MFKFCESEKIRILKRSKVNPEDYIGKVFGRVKVIDCYWAKVKGKNRMFVDYICECGNTKTGYIEHLNSGRIASCGCLTYEHDKNRNTKHNLYNDNKRLYGVWNSMIQRCINPNNTNYEYYGGRGIKVCEEWMGENGFQNFYNWAIANGYDCDADFGQCTIDRKDVNGNYEPSNCRWVDMFTQIHNRRPYGTCKICSDGN